MSKLRFYLDENVNLIIAEQLKQKDIEAISVREMALLREDDDNHLLTATNMGYVLCTHDQDFLRIATQTTDHEEIIFTQQSDSTIGGWVKALTQLSETMDSTQIRGQVVFISAK